VNWKKLSKNPQLSAGTFGHQGVGRMDRRAMNRRASLYALGLHFYRQVLCRVIEANRIKY